MKRLKFLAHFASGGGQDVVAANREEAIRKGTTAARAHGTTLADITGPDDEEAPE